MEKRIPKKSDQENITKAFEMLKKFMQNHPKFNPLYGRPLYGVV